jgi:hypothetical protein
MRFSHWRLRRRYRLNRLWNWLDRPFDGLFDRLFDRLFIWIDRHLNGFNRRWHKSRSDTEITGYQVLSPRCMLRINPISLYSSIFRMATPCFIHWQSVGERGNVGKSRTPFHSPPTHLVTDNHPGCTNTRVAGRCLQCRHLMHLE